jgi:hypothetical protein
VNYISNGKSDLMFTSNNKDMAQLADRCWKQMGEKPFDDPYMEGKET